MGKLNHENKGEQPKTMTYILEVELSPEGLKKYAKNWFEVASYIVVENNGSIGS